MNEDGVENMMVHWRWCSTQVTIILSNMHER